MPAPWGRRGPVASARSPVLRGRLRGRTQIAVQPPPYLRAGAVKEDALVALGEPEMRAHVLGGPAVDVAERDHVALRGAEARDRRAELADGLLPDQLLVGRQGRAARLGELDDAGRDAGERERPALAPRVRGGRVDQDPEDPRLEGRAALEAADRADDRGPGLLDGLLCDGAAAALGDREREQAVVVALVQLRVRPLVAGAERAQQPALVQRCDGRAQSGSSSSRDARTWSAPPSASSAAVKWPLATATDTAPAPFAAATSSGVSPTTKHRSGVSERP